MGADGLFSTYINGALAHTYAATSPLTDYVPGAEVLCIGSLSGSSFFQGMIVDARVWNVRRTAAEIAANYQTRLTGSEAGLLGYWNFDNGTANDMSGNGYHGSLLADATTVLSAQPFAANTDPVAGTGIAAAADTGQTVSVTLTGSDPDGTPVMFALVSPNSAFGVPLTLTDADETDDTATVSYTGATAGADTFDFTVSE